VSVVIPDVPFGYGEIESFCPRMHFLASEEAAARWVAGHMGTTLLPVAEAFRLGRALSDWIAPDVLSGVDGPQQGPRGD